MFSYYSLLLVYWGRFDFTGLEGGLSESFKRCLYTCSFTSALVMGRSSGIKRMNPIDKIRNKPATYFRKLRVWVSGDENPIN